MHRDVPQVQRVKVDVLEEKVGKHVAIGETFTTKSGTWRVITYNVDSDTYSVERLDDGNDAS